MIFKEIFLSLIIKAWESLSLFHVLNFLYYVGCPLSFFREIKGGWILPWVVSILFCYYCGWDHSVGLHQMFLFFNFVLTFRSKLHGYDDVVERVAQHLSLDDPSKIRLTSHNCYSQQPKPTPIKYRGVEHLSDMLVHYNQVLIFYLFCYSISICIHFCFYHPGFPFFIIILISEIMSSLNS